jgi:predicted dienelactone hydrolase
MKRAFTLALVFLAAACASQQQTGAPVGPVKVGEYTTDIGASPVGVIPVATLHDARRNKDVEISIEYPTRGGPFPVIVWSHGYGGSNQSYEPLVSYWVSNGFVVIRPSHADKGALADLMRDTIRDAYQQRPDDRTRRQQQRPQPQPQSAQGQPPAPPPFRPNPMEAIWEKEREPQWRDRAADVILVLDQLSDLTNRFPELREKVDATKIGVGGHSYGALTAMMVGGVGMTADPRVKALLLMSPPGPAANRGLTQQSFLSLRLPVMFMTGTRDRGATETEDAAWRKQAFEFAQAGAKYLSVIEGATHTTFTGRSSSTFDVSQRMDAAMPVSTPNPNQPPQIQPGTPTNATSPAFYSDRTLFQKVKIVSMIYWEAELKNLAKARELLVQEKMPSGVTISSK